MTKKSIKVSYIQIFLILSIIVTFLPNGIIYASGQAAKIIRILYVIQFLIYSATLGLCLRKRADLITLPIISFIVWGMILLLSTFRYSKDLITVLRALLYLLGIVTVFVVVKYMFKYQRSKLFWTIYGLFTIFSFVNLITLILKPNGLYNVDWQGATYWFGGKFTTFYMFYTWLCLYAIKKRIKNIIAYIPLFMVGLFICVRVNCSTGIACIYISFFLILGRKIIVKIKPWMLIAIVLGITITMVISNTLFNSTMIQYFVKNVLHRSSTMTGRIEIYGSFFEIMRRDFWLGAGFDNSIIMRNTTLGYLNAQNGILDVITQTGIIGLVPFIITIYGFWKEGIEHFDKIENQLVAIFLLGFFFCSFGEISFNSYFFLLLVLISGDLSKVTRKKCQVSK